MKKENIINENIEQAEFSDVLKQSYIDYSMSVITARAIPDARDGLKPVQRRLLYDMDKLHVDYNKPTKKCARIVGDTMGKYHPHGSSSLYEALVVMSQPFKKGIPLIDGQGNMGSIEGDEAAAERYTEARLQKFTQDTLLTDIEYTVPFVPNYDNLEVEPEVLPARLPMLLINGAEGIAVGMATFIPSHNLFEVCEICKDYISNPKISVSKLLEKMPGPDFSTGGIISNKDDLLNIYETGTGKIKIRGKIIFEKAINKREKDKLVITEIPYTMIGSGIEKFMTDVAKLVEDKVLPEIIDISNQSNKEGIRIVLDIKQGSDIERIKNILYKKTKLEDTFGVNMLAIDHGTPKIVNLKEILSIWYEFQKEILTKKYQYLLEKSKDKKELQEGLIKAYDCIDLIIEVIRGSKTREIAKSCLTKGITDDIIFKTKTNKTKASKLNFTENQADAILNMKLQSLIGLEIDLLKSEYNKTIKNIETYSSILSSKIKLNNVIKNDLSRFQKEFSSERKTELKNCEEIIIEEKREIFNCYVLIDKFGYCKMIDASTYERNIETISDQYRFCINTTSDSKIFIFVNTGYLYQVKCSEIPLCKYKEKGEPLENLSSFKGDAEIINVLENNNMNELLFITKNGFAKFISGKELISNKKEIIATKLAESDELNFVYPYNNEKYLIFYNNNHYILKINTSEIPKLKKSALGIKGMETKNGFIESVFLVNDSTITINNKEFNTHSIRASKKGSIGKKIK